MSGGERRPMSDIKKEVNKAHLLREEIKGNIYHMYCVDCDKLIGSHHIKPIINCYCGDCLTKRKIVVD